MKTIRIKITLVLSCLILAQPAVQAMGTTPRTSTEGTTPSSPTPSSPTASEMTSAPSASFGSPSTTSTPLASTRASESVLEILRQDPQSFVSLLPRDITDKITRDMKLSEYEAIKKYLAKWSPKIPIPQLDLEKNLDHALTTLIDLCINNLGIEICLTEIGTNHEHIFNYLRDKGVNLNTTVFDYTPLTYAIDENMPEAVKRLIRAGADVNLQDNNDNTPLTLAIKYRENMVPLLIQEKADVNKPNPKGETPLFIAYQRKNRPLVKALIQAGATIGYLDRIKAWWSSFNY